MATHRKFLLAAQSSWQARHRLRFSRWPGLQESSQLVSHRTWNQDLRHRGGLASRDRSVSTGQAQTRFGQLTQVPAGQSDSRASLEGRQPNLGPEDLQKQANRRNGESEGV